MSRTCQWDKCLVTWWLYFYGKPLTGVRAHILATPEEVRAEAIRQRIHTPLYDPANSIMEIIAKIAMCEVRL